MTAVTVETESVRSSDMFSSPKCALLLADDVRDAIRKHPVRSGEDVQRLSQQGDLAVRRHTMAEEPLVNQASGYSGFLVNGVFPERLIRRVDIDLHVFKFKSRVHLFVQEREKCLDVLWPLISR